LHWPLTFELFNAQVDPLAEEIQQRAFEAFSAYETLEVAELAADDAEQPPIGAGWMGVNRAAGQRQERGLALLKPLAQYGAGLIEADRVA
jgi:hypothetical protein